MSSIATRPATEVAAHVAATLDGIFATIDGWRALLEEALGADAALKAESVDPLVAAFAEAAVSHDTLLTGAGFVAAPGALADAEWHLAWWLRDSSEGTARRLATIDDPILLAPPTK